MASRRRYPPWKKSTPIRQIASLPSATHTGFYKLASQLPPRDCSAQALLRPHNDGLLHSNQKKGVVDEFHTESDTIQILAKVGYPIAGDIRSA